MYWYSAPRSFWGTELWGKSTTIPGSTVRIKTYGNEVTQKKCKRCGVDVWSNNNDKVCGRLSCWLSDTKRRDSLHVKVI
jgi:hypothetical protein